MFGQSELFQIGSPSLTFDADLRPPARIVVIGIGGAGCNSINQMIESNLQGVDFVVANTDVQALRASRAPLKLELGMKLTKGLGCGGNPEIGRQAALEEIEPILDLLQGADMVFITGGEGGGTFTGAAPIFACLAAETGALSIAVATMPFKFQGAKRCSYSRTGLEELQQAAHSVIVVENESLIQALGQNVLLEEAFRFADGILCKAVQGLSEVVSEPGIINIDLADVRTVMQHKGMILMGRAEAEGPNRAIEAARLAISGPLENGIPKAKAVLVNIAGGRQSLKLDEARAAAATIKEQCNVEDLIIGATYNDRLGARLRVTTIATGLTRTVRRERAAPGIEMVSTKPMPPQECRAGAGRTRTASADLDSPSFTRRRAV